MPLDNFPLPVFRALTPLDADSTLEFYTALHDVWLELNICQTRETQVLFLTHALWESGKFVNLEENLNYSAKRLQTVWPNHFTPKLAEQYALQPEKIANRVYSNRMGNGDEASGDGWRYRGRGIFQLTGHDNYHRLAAELGQELNDEFCDRLLTATGACLAAGYYWRDNVLDTLGLADSTLAINAVVSSLKFRQEFYNEIWQELRKPTATV